MTNKKAHRDLKRIRARHRKPAILIFGEGGKGEGQVGSNDAKALKHLLPHINPGLSDRYTIKAMRNPVSLTRTAGAAAVRGWMSKIRDTVAGELAPVAAIVVHQDSDGPDRDGQRHATLLRTMQAELSCSQLVPVVPVHMTEAWWFLFPEAVKAVNPQAWRSLNWPVGDVETKTDPKQDLSRLTKRTSRTYAEGDSESIARNIAQLQLQPIGVSASWARFARDIHALE